MTKIGDYHELYKPKLGDKIVPDDIIYTLRDAINKYGEQKVLEFINNYIEYLRNKEDRDLLWTPPAEMTEGQILDCVHDLVRNYNPGKK